MAQQTPRQPRRVSDEEVRETILAMCRAAGHEGAVRPEEIARAILPEQWRTLLSRIRLMSKQLARAGDVTILRKGKPADPKEFKGLYRLRIADEPTVSS